jgi:hypothetical protein
MSSSSDVIVCVPKEYISEFTQIIRVGLKEAKLSREVRQNLMGWWDAESEFIQDELNQPQKTND